MKIYIRDKRTGQFFAGDNRWVSEVADALEFRSSYEAVSEAAKYGLRSNLEALYCFPDPKDNFTVSLDKAR